MFQKLLMTGGPSTSDFNKPSHGLKVCKLWLFPSNCDYFFWWTFIYKWKTILKCAIIPLQATVIDALNELLSELESRYVILHSESSCAWSMFFVIRNFYKIFFQHYLIIYLYYTAARASSLKLSQVIHAVGA